MKGKKIESNKRQVTMSNHSINYPLPFFLPLSPALPTQAASNSPTSGLPVSTAPLPLP